MPQAELNGRLVKRLTYTVLTETSNGVRILSIFRQCNAGLFSELSVLLSDLIECRKRNLLVHEISAGIGLEMFKDTSLDDPIIHMFKKPLRSEAFLSLPIIEMPYSHLDFIHGDYQKINFQGLRGYLEMFFRPSKLVKEYIYMLSNKYTLLPGEYNSICYRGTDKATEIPRKDPILYAQKYKDAIKNLIKIPKVLIQTDEYKTRSLLSSMLKNYNSFYFDEMPVTKSSVAIHLHTLLNGRVDFAKKVLAVNFLISRANYLITHTGNMSLWQVLSRGNMINVYQL